MTEPTDTREKIIKAALRLFGENGYSATSTRAIASEAGINEVTLFRHFGSKQNLFEACIASFNEAGFASTFTDHLTGDYAADIRMMARMTYRETIASYDALRMLICDMSQVPEMREIALQGARGNLERIAAYFRQQIQAGVVRDDLSPYALAHTLDSLFSSSLLVQHMFKASLTPQLAEDDLIDQMAAIFVQGTLKK